MCILIHIRIHLPVPRLQRYLAFASNCLSRANLQLQQLNLFDLSPFTKANIKLTLISLISSSTKILSSQNSISDQNAVMPLPDLHCLRNPFMVLQKFHFWSLCSRPFYFILWRYLQECAADKNNLQNRFSVLLMFTVRRTEDEFYQIYFKSHIYCKFSDNAP